MSVINDMLRDLEQRKAPDREGTMTSSSGSVVEAQSSGSARSVGMAVGLVVLLAVIAAFSWQTLVDTFFEEASDARLAINTQSTQASPSSGQKVVQAESAQIVESVGDNTRNSSEEKREASKEVSTEESSTPVKTEVTQNAGSVIKVEPATEQSQAESTSTTGAKPGPNVASAEPALLAQNSTKTASEANTQKEIVKRVASVASPQSADASVATSSNKGQDANTSEKASVRQLSDAARDRQTAEKAQSLFKRGEISEGYRLLYDVLAMNREDHRSRAVLASQLMKEQRLAEAGDILVMADVSTSADLRQLKARWLMQQGNAELALHTLRQQMPVLKDYPDYYALLASYYQQQGYQEQAAEIYRQLVEYDPGVSSWWAGLGLSLDRSQRYVEAAQAYRRALQVPGLSPALRQFSQQRLKVLEG